MSGLLLYAYEGKIAKMKQLLAEGANIAEKDGCGWGVLQYAAANSQYKAMQWLLVEGGASADELRNDAGYTVWSCLRHQIADATELSSLLKVMVMLDDAPAYFIARLSPQHAELCSRGRQLRMQLPSYLEQQRADIVTNCPLPTVLQALVIGYAVTTPEDMWTDGLRILRWIRRRSQ
jgi:hypothetical protein